MASRAQQKQKPDLVMLGIIIFLALWGLAEVAGISFSFSVVNFGNSWYYVLRQLMRIVAGLLAGFVVYKLPPQAIKKVAPFLFLLNLALLLVVLIPQIGHSSGGAQRWFSLGFGGIAVQPSEFLKITFILYLAALLANRAEQIKQNNIKEHLLKQLAPFIIVLIIVFAVLIAQPDMSTLGIICLAGLAMYFASPAPWWHTFAVGSCLGVFGFIFIKTSAYRLQRLTTFLNPNFDPLGAGWQTKQAEIALGSGKVFGSGGGFNFGLSKLKALVPHPMTDSIFAIIGEELGFFGSILLISVFLFFLFWSFKLAVKSQDNFKKLAIIGIASWITFQAFFNIAGIIGSVPLGGVPLPFFSFGGSHIISELIAMGVLLNFSKS